MRTGGRNHFLGEGSDKGLILTGLRFADKVHRSGGQCVKHPQIQGGHQNYRQRNHWEQLFQKFQTVHPWHFYIQSHDVGLKFIDLGPGILCVKAGGNHLDLWGGV